mgnify:CR=1 FL=1
MSLPRADQLDIAMYWAARKLGITRKFDMGITDYGHRGVPNVFLSAPLRSDGRPRKKQRS